MVIQGIHDTHKVLKSHKSKMSVIYLYIRSCPTVRKALSEAGYDVELKYNPNKKTKQKNRKWNIIWFNPPYSKNLVTKVGHYFLKLLDKHFPRHHKLHKIYNKNTVKVSYSCT